MTAMSEDKARTKWCPHTVYCADNNYQTFNNKPDGRDKPFCIASDCMAWRPVKRLGGYCGLAGPPADRDSG
jgi:hypothetical protein